MNIAPVVLVGIVAAMIGVPSIIARGETTPPTAGTTKEATPSRFQEGPSMQLAQLNPQAPKQTQQVPTLQPAQQPSTFQPPVSNEFQTLQIVQRL